MGQGKRQLQKEATREHILRTAMRLFSENGFLTTTGDVAREAGVSHGSVFVHFPTREDLQLRVLEQFTDDIGGKLHDLADSDSDMPELLRAHLSVLEEYELFYRRLISERNSLPEETKNMMIAMQSAVSWNFAKAMKRGVEAGTLKELPVHVVFNTWVGLVHYYLSNGELFAPGGSVLKRCKDELVSSFMLMINKSLGGIEPR